MASNCEENALVRVSSLLCDVFTIYDSQPTLFLYSVSAMFCPEWASNFGLNATDKLEANTLLPYENHIKELQSVFVSKFDDDATTAGRKSAARHDKSGNLQVVLQSTRHLERSDKGKARGSHDQENFALRLVSTRWSSGDPIGVSELKIEICLRDDCQEGMEFYQKYIDPNNSSAQSGFSNWIKGLFFLSGPLALSCLRY